MADPKHSSEESLKDSPSPNIQAVASIRDVPGSDKEKKNELTSSERSSIKLCLNEIGQIDLLKPEQEVQLARRIAKGDKQARDMMIRANLRLVVKIANDYSNYGLPLSDLVSERNIGLIKAVERFDPDKGGKLSTYAAWWIKQASNVPWPTRVNRSDSRFTWSTRFPRSAELFQSSPKNWKGNRPMKKLASSWEFRLVK